jgi:cold shock CspA family protein
MIRTPHPSTRFRLAFAAIGLLLVIGAGACGDDDGEEAATDDTVDETTTAEVEETTSTTEDESETTVTTEAVDTTTTTEATGGLKDKDEPVGEVDESGVDPWSQTALPYRGQVGEVFDHSCPAGGVAGAVWGTNVYTDDSSVCTAAVHVGLITLEEGGDVVFEIEDGTDEYVGSESNGITSSDYPSWGGSFSFPDATPVEVSQGIPWNRRAADFVGEVELGEPITVTCRADGEEGVVWGTDIYTDDSSICTAAVHAGLITFADGGEVTFELVEGQEAYTGSTANGVTTNDYGSWGGSFSFVAPGA